MILKGKTFLITGIASERSIAYAIAQSAHEQGANLILTYQNEKLKSRVEAAAGKFGASAILNLDVSSDENMSAFADKLAALSPNGIDGVVHAIAYADRSQLEGTMLANMTRDGFLTAHNISSYSLTALTQACLPHLNENSSIVTLTYIGSQRAMPSYNAMGLAKASLESMVRYLAYELGSKNIRVNAISAGAIRTLAASGIKGFKQLQKQQSQITPLKGTLTNDDVGKASTFLLSDWSKAVTGEVIYVDNGYHLVGAHDLQTEGTQ